MVFYRLALASGGHNSLSSVITGSGFNYGQYQTVLKSKFLLLLFHCQLVQVQ